MHSERLLTIASLVDREDVVIDVGCDHGYLSIYLKENKLCKNVYASDINNNALNNAAYNIEKKNLDIETFLSDGLNNIPVKFNTAVIAGMGTETILHILDSEKRPNKLILASHNEYYKLRKAINKLGYKIAKEVVVYEKGHYYVILKCLKDKQKLNYAELKFGLSHNVDYYNYLMNKNKELIKKVPLFKKIKLIKDNYLLKGLTEKK